MRNVWGEIDIARDAAYTVPFTINDPGADRVVGTGDDQTFQTLALPANGIGDRSRLHQQRRTPTPTSTPWSSRSTAASPASG